VLFKGTGTDTIRNRIIDSDFESVSEASSMHEAVTQARSVAVAGDIILMSPGFASFGMFTNEYDRGDQFMREIQ
jgi:UDP-N-acetylmuramoylalanine--D-glutamate ligase